MRSWVIILLGIGLGMPHVFAQQNSIPKHAISLEVLGTGIVYSVNYEYYFHRNPFFRCAGRVGFNYLRFQNQGDNIGSSIIPVSLNTVFFEGKHHFELDFGVMAYGFYKGKNRTEKPFGIFPMLSPGYRYQPEDDGLFFKVSITPWYFPQPVAKDAFAYWPGIALGYGF